MTTKLRTIIERPKVKTSELLAECKSLFPVWLYYKDAQLNRDFPPPKEATTHYFRDVVEADEKYKDKSAEDLEKAGIVGITLRERLIMELDHFKETGGHFDVENITLCTGSRGADGSVPVADWDDGEFRVSWAYPGSSYPRLRSRERFLTLDPLPSDPSSDLEARLADLSARVERLEEWERRMGNAFDV